MFKAFSLLWLVVFLPIIFLIFSYGYSPVWLFNSYTVKSNLVNQGSGTFYLIEQELNVIPEAQWQQKIALLAQEFGFELQLLPLHDATQDAIHQQDLHDGNYVVMQGFSGKLLRRIGNSQWVISSALGISESEHYTRTTKGAVYLMRKTFDGKPRQQWPELLDELSRNFGYQLTILPVAELTLTKDKITQLENNELVWHKVSATELYFYGILPDGKSALRAITPPVNEGGAFFVIFVIFILIVSICMFIWVYPLWRDLKRLSITADNFGDGYLTQRAELAKTSAVARLGRSFNQMADRIEKLIQGQKELTNAIAHDLRTPLYRLRFAFEMLNADEATEKEQQKYKRSIHTSVDDLDHLINQTLILSRYNRVMDISHFSECDLASNIANEIDHYSLENKELTVSFDLSPELKNSLLLVDNRALLRALNNLLSNAARYAKKQVKVNFDIDNTWYVLSVEDDGPGISEQQWQSVFEPFVQLKNTHRNTANGHGLGLAIVQQIAIWHKGHAKITHSVLGGVKFNLRWPRPLK